MDKDFMDLILKHMKKNDDEMKEAVLQQRQKEIERLTKRSGISKKFAYKGFSDFFITDSNYKALKRAQSFVENFKTRKKGLLFVGGVGTGKTRLAAAVLNALIANLHTVYFGNITDIITTIKATYNKNSSLTEADIIEIITSADLLILDDLGKENNTQHTSSLIYQIINKLYETEKFLVVTTNFRSGELAKSLGDIGMSVISRIYEMCEIVEMEGEDWRLKK